MAKIVKADCRNLSLFEVERVTALDGTVYRSWECRSCGMRYSQDELQEAIEDHDNSTGEVSP